MVILSAGVLVTTALTVSEDGATLGPSSPACTTSKVEMPLTGSKFLLGPEAVQRHAILRHEKKTSRVLRIGIGNFSFWDSRAEREAYAGVDLPSYTRIRS